MMNPWIVLIGLVVIAVGFVALPVGLSMSARYRRWKIVGCARTYRPAAILVGRAGLAEALGIRALRRVRSCSLWPERYGCDRRCLDLADDEVHDAPTVSTPAGVEYPPLFLRRACREGRGSPGRSVLQRPARLAGGHDGLRLSWRPWRFSSPAARRPEE